jgi:hypothetical protein
MLTFPKLKTGSAVQYPIDVAQSFSTEVLQFLAGDEQRYLKAPGLLRTWQIQLNRLDEAELQTLEAFFVAASGSFDTFTFTDPDSGTSFPNCFIAQEVLQERFTGELRSGLSLVIQQGRT